MKLKLWFTKPNRSVIDGSCGYRQASLSDKDYLVRTQSFMLWGGDVACWKCGNSTPRGSTCSNCSAENCKIPSSFEGETANLFITGGVDILAVSQIREDRLKGHWIFREKADIDLYRRTVRCTINYILQHS
jgi:hypothetical protein